MRGDDPDFDELTIDYPASSPHARGMIRLRNGAFQDGERVPRMRGDDPYNIQVTSAGVVSSPHARG